MISLMKDLEIMRNSPPSVTATADRPFLGMENPQEGASISDGGYGGVSSELRVFPVVDSAENMADLEAGVSEIGEERGFGYLGEKVKLESDGGDEDMLSLVGEDRGSFVEPSDLMHGFRVGDMVWGKVKSHPWWPGHIFNEAFASPSVRRMKGEGHVLVAFFGDSSYGWFDPAELIPFELHFPEKSRQTTSRSFVRAVEEAVDEASRRGALALACRCRNQHNYRPTAVAGYFAVDVVGYEPGGLYSSMQIKDARDHFVPLELLSFIHQLALGSCRNNGNTIEWIQTLAMLLAYRRSVFEEFDETYAQAFGVEPVRPSYNSVGVLDQTGRFAPRVAPLSGPLVVAEALGERRSSTRLASHKPARVSKNKYELKRRDELPVAATSSLSDLHSASQQPHHAFLPSLPDSGEPPAFGMGFNYVVPKTEKPPFSLPSNMAADPFNDSKPGSEGFFLPEYMQKPEHVEVKNEWGSSDSVEPTVPFEGSRGMDVVVKEKGSKRPREDLIDAGEVKKKKKKKKDGLGFVDRHAVFLDVDRHGMVGGRSIVAGHRSVPELVPQEDGINVELPPGLELSSLQLPQLIDDLSSIALDPFYGVEQDAPAIVRHVFLRFRSLVYQKSLFLFGASEPAAPSQSFASRDGRGQREPSSSSYTSKPASKLGDGTKAARKRDPSDRQEDLAVKKMKKMTRLKELASKKKDAMRKSNYLLQKQQLQQPKDQKDSASSAATEVTRKQELPQRAKPPSPTFLTMKFPPRSTLPSVANLKARFARFGPLEPSATRVYWKSYSCKVLFKYKSDAQLAYDFVKNNDLFGQVKVFYNLRDVEISVPDQPPDSASLPSDLSRPDKDPLQYLHGSAGLQKPSSSQAQQSQMQLKSILKKPGGEESGSNGAAATAGSGAIVRESPRVKFLLKADNNRVEAPSKVAISGSNGGGQAHSLPSADQIIRQSLKSVGFSPMPPLPSSSSMSTPQPLQLPSRGLEVHPHRIPSSAFQQMPLPKEELMQPPWAPQPRSVDFHSILGQQRSLDPPDILRERGNLDISGPMLSLLLKCNEIVGKVKSSLGYTPYHTL